jgi:hypothetical protein
VRAQTATLVILRDLFVSEIGLGFTDRARLHAGRDYSLWTPLNGLPSMLS